MFVLIQVLILLIIQITFCGNLIKWMESGMKSQKMKGAREYTVGRDSVVGVPTRYTVGGSNRGGAEIFRTLPYRPWAPPSLLYSWYRVITGVRRLGRGIDYPPLLVPMLKSRAIHLLPLWAFVACSRMNFTV
jgi:hypothetical protein